MSEPVEQDEGEVYEVPRDRLLELAASFGANCPRCCSRAFKTVGGKLACDGCGNHFERGSADNCIQCNEPLGDGREALCLGCFVDGNLPDSTNDY